MKRCSPCVPARMCFALLASVALVATSVLRLNAAMGIVAMVNHTAVQEMEGAKNKSHEGECPAQEPAAEEDGPFAWRQDEQARILGAYFVGYLLTQCPGAFLARYMSAKWMTLASISVNIAGSLAVPVTARQGGANAVAGLRVVQGLFAGVTFPCIMMMTSKWSPPKERTLLSGIVCAGFSLGIVMTNLFSGLLAKYMGWQWVFYLLALVFTPWCPVWAIMAADSPEKSLFITDEELAYIHAEQLKDAGSVEEQSPPFPWKDVFRSRPFWALLVCTSCSDTAYYMTQSYTPKFMKEVLHRNLEQNAVWSTLPYLINWALNVGLGAIVDMFMEKKWFTNTTARQIVVCIGGIVPASCLLAIGFIGCDDAALGIVFMTLSLASLTDWVGLIPNHIDLSPNFAGLLISLTNTATAIPGFLVPIGIGYLTNDNNTLEQWSIAFDLIAVVLVLMTIIFCLFGSGEVQPWNKPKERIPVVEKQSVVSIRNRISSFLR